MYMEHYSHTEKEKTTVLRESLMWCKTPRREDEFTDMYMYVSTLRGDKIKCTTKSTLISKQIFTDTLFLSLSKVSRKSNTSLIKSDLEGWQHPSSSPSQKQTSTNKTQSQGKNNCIFAYVITFRIRMRMMMYSSAS